MNGKVLMVNGKNNDILKIVVAIKEGYLTKDNVFTYYYVFSYIITYGENLRLLLVICIISLVLL